MACAVPVVISRKRYKELLIKESEYESVVKERDRLKSEMAIWLLEDKKSKLKPNGK